MADENRSMTERARDGAGVLRQGAGGVKGFLSRNKVRFAVAGSALAVATVPLDCWAAGVFAADPVSMVTGEAVATTHGIDQTYTIRNTTKEAMHHVDVRVRAVYGPVETVVPPVLLPGSAGNVVPGANIIDIARLGAHETDVLQIREPLSAVKSGYSPWVQYRVNGGGWHDVGASGN